MFQRDYFLRMIEEAGQVLAQLLGLRSQQREAEATRLLEEVYSAYFPASRHAILHTDPDALVPWLLETYQLSDSHLEVLALLLGEEAEWCFVRGNWPQGKAHLQAALSILEHLNAAQPDLYDWQRVQQIDALRTRLANPPGDSQAPDQD